MLAMTHLLDARMVIERVVFSADCRDLWLSTVKY